MTTTQYIGARYVPLFASPIDWDSTQAYDALTIVYYAGNSYTSRQAVPAGIQITNEDYWALTGNYNAQIEQYRSEVKTYDGRITTADTTANDALSLAQTNEKDIATLDSEMAGTADSGLKTLITSNTDSITAETARAEAAELVNKNSIDANKADADSKFSGESDSGLKTLISNNTANITTNTANITTNTANITTNTASITNEISRASNAESNLKSMINAIPIRPDFVDEHIVFIGDSYVQGNWTSGVSVTSATIDLLGLTNAHVYGNGGAGFVVKGDTAYPNKNYYNMLQDVINPELSSIADSVTKVVFIGGWNDISQSGIASSVTNTLKYARSIFKNATLINLFVNCGSVANTKIKERNTVYKEYMIGTMQGGGSFSSCRALPWHLSNPSNDGIHPTADVVNNYIAPWIAAALYNNGVQDDYLGDIFVNNALDFDIKHICPDVDLTINFDLTFPLKIYDASYTRECDYLQYIMYSLPSLSGAWYTIPLEHRTDGSVYVTSKQGITGTYHAYQICCQPKVFVK